MKIVTIGKYRLFQNYPNPFNPQTTIAFTLAKSDYVNLKIFNLLGEEMETLVSEQLPTGTHTYKWNASSFPSGIYVYRLKAGEFVETKKMIMIR